jgi:predicted transcriptional regulator YdeE
MNPFYIDNSYTHLYCTDPIRSAKWYNDHLGCRLITLNGNGFATLQLAPGRILFLTKDTDAARKIGFIVTNIVGLRNHLNKLNAVIEDNDDPESTWFMMTDPDGNRIEIWNGDRFGVDHVTYTAPSWVENHIWCSFDEKEASYVLAVPIDGTQNPDLLAEKLFAACSEMSAIPKNKVVITIFNSNSQHAVHACIELVEPPAEDVAADFEMIHIPQHKYAVFHCSKDEQFRETYKDKYAWLFALELNKPDQPAFILEFHHDDGVQSYLPIAY